MKRKHVLTFAGLVAAAAAGAFFLILKPEIRKPWLQTQGLLRQW